MFNNEAQDFDETLTIPANHFVHMVDFDADQPFLKISPVSNVCGAEIGLKVPKALAYYLSTHHCGSMKMRENYKKDARNDIKNTIFHALGFEEFTYFDRTNQEKIEKLEDEVNELKNEIRNNKK